MSESNAPSSHPIALSPLAKKLGISIDSVTAERVVASMPYRDDNTTVGDLVHGGALLSLADCAATAAAWSEVTDRSRYRGATIELSMSFLSGARSANVRAEARVLRRGESICFCDVAITTENGVAIAQARVAYKLSKIQTPGETMSALFARQPLDQQMKTLAELERAGARVYRAFAEQTKHERDKAELLASADREEANAAILDRLHERSSR